MNRRQKNKLLKNSIIMVDMSTIPKGVTIMEYIEYVNKRGIVVYDGEKGHKPFIFPKRNSKAITFLPL